VLEIQGGGVVFSASDEPGLCLSLEGNESRIVEVELLEDLSESDIRISVSHLTVVDAEVLLDVHIFEGTEERDIHINDNDRIEVHYIVWNADTDEQLDEGDLLVTAGDDGAYIYGFGWSAIGLDIDNDRGLIPGIDTGTAHTTLLPPPIAYGNSDGHELQDCLAAFRVEGRQGPIS
jgi:hypothetical protein